MLSTESRIFLFDSVLETAISKLSKGRLSSCSPGAELEENPDARSPGGNGGLVSAAELTRRTRWPLTEAEDTAVEDGEDLEDGGADGPADNP